MDAPSPQDPVAAREWLTAQAHALGFDRVRYAAAGPTPGPERLRAFLDEGRHASMGWLAETAGQRLDPRRLLPGARTVMALGVDYAWPAPPDPGPGFGRVACYAWGRDYHNLVLRRLRKLRARFQAAWPGARGWVGVDREPGWERAWAEASGLGFAGKNACIIAPGDTSLFFLGLVFLSVELPPDPPIGEFCGSCRRCLDICPTGAFLGPHRLDAGRCISYFTIEHDGPIPEALRPGFGPWVFGCDACQEVCPHVRPRSLSHEPDFQPRHAWLDLAELLDTPDEALVERFTGTPLRRAAPRRLKRNACVALGNRPAPYARPALERARCADDPLLAEHAAWALDRWG